jgi:hypothetical protein
MSRRQIRPRDPAHKVIIGWDHPLQTYFAHVIDRKKEAAGRDDKFVLWIGAAPREICEVEDLRQRIKPWAYINAEIGAKLYGDKDEGL